MHLSISYKDAWRNACLDDKTLSLAYSMYTNPGVYAVLLGSGVSRAAGIPTGWEIILDLCRKLAVAAGEDAQPAPERWYEGKFGKEPRYDDLLAALASTPTERNRILNVYFVPTPEEREQGLKLPTATHSTATELAPRITMNCFWSDSVLRRQPQERPQEPLSHGPQVVCR